MSKTTTGAKDVPNVPSRGNTVFPTCPLPGEETTPESDNGAKHYCFTLNNYQQEDIQICISHFEEKCKRYIFQEEMGEVNNTPHLQGYFEYNTKRRWLPFKNLFTRFPHIEIARSKSQNYQACVNYCGKEETRNGKIYKANCKVTREVKTLKEEQLYGWEREIIQLISNEPDDRSIYWYWSREGNTGKTTFGKYLFLKHGAIILEGKRDNILNAILSYKQNTGDTPELVIWDIPRSVDDQYISYEALEKAKNMFFYSGKYEGGMVAGNPPHLIVFSNQPPTLSEMSRDRWVVKNIDDTQNYPRQRNTREREIP